jgi:hypothetical protein
MTWNLHPFLLPNYTTIFSMVCCLGLREDWGRQFFDHYFCNTGSHPESTTYWELKNTGIGPRVMVLCPAFCSRTNGWRLLQLATSNVSWDRSLSGWDNKLCRLDSKVSSMKVGLEICSVETCPVLDFTGLILSFKKKFCVSYSVLSLVAGVYSALFFFLRMGLGWTI